ncbi:hypothetical protein [Pontibacter pamirensis]|uniref:hypothetical protein n=1 Tax=Pontibacter pamirensis TaxID=2562824 RepID=UPI001389C721|nr:hypothetical protein [Pontibacter pamirensis]
MGASCLKKLYVLLAVLLCSVLTLAVPVVSQAASPDIVASTLQVDADNESPFQLTAGDVSPGDAEAVLQLDKSPLSQVFQNLLQQKYPEQADAPAVPSFYSFSRRDCGLYTILTKGP